jgi:hypothetical protein
MQLGGGTLSKQFVTSLGYLYGAPLPLAFSLSCPPSFTVVAGFALWPGKHQGQKYRVAHSDTV